MPLLLQSDDICSNCVEATFNITITAVNLVDILNGAYAIGAHRSNEQRHSRTNIGRGHLCSTKLVLVILTDDCSAVELMGAAVRLVEGEERNIKITTPLDLKIAEMLLEEEK